MTSTVHKVVSRALEALQERGIRPVVVGGVAMILHGSDRSTKDADFLVGRASQWEEVMSGLYAAGFCLITKLNEDGSPRRILREEVIAKLKAREELPDSLFFWHPEEQLRLDVLVDFPVPASGVAERAEAQVLAGVSILVASRADLKEMKIRALMNRDSAKDSIDFMFLGGTEEELAELRARFRAKRETPWL